MTRRSLGLVLKSGLLVAAIALSGCSGSDGAAGTSKGTLTGQVTNKANGNSPVAGASVVTTPAIAGLTITTDANGEYSVLLPVGNYVITAQAANFQSAESQMSVLAAVSQTCNLELDPVSNVIVNIAGGPSDPLPGSTFTLTATVTPMDGSTVQSYAWSQTHSAAAAITGDNTPTPSITLGDLAEYKAALLSHLQVQDRFEILGVDPYALELGGMVAFECAVTTTSGTYTKDIEVHAKLEFAAVCTGLRNLPIGVPVLLGGADQASYNWTLNRPPGSTVALMDADTRFPWFVPDVGGIYTVNVTKLANNSNVMIELNAGEWAAGIVGMDANGRPETSCALACHATVHNDKFVDWSRTGHAEIFTDNINTGGHYGPSCFPCHTVGYQTGGFDSTTGFTNFMSAMFPGGMSHPNAANWDNTLANWPEQAKFANIQCDNCHGPTGTGSAHRIQSDRRISVSAAVCGTCHGEPLRHARYQQWQRSGHANFEVAISESSSSCSKCHTAQGHLAWAEAGWDPGFSGVSVDPAEAQPITCVVCHDPHNVGTTSGNASNAHMRLEGNTPMLLAGYQAVGVGKGAMCIVCHNTRRGEADAVVTTTPDQVPHRGAQGDVLLGQNAFFVDNVRGPHSLIEDTCTSCHVERTPPPADLSYQLGGTNHTFAASPTICADCHGEFTAESVKGNTEHGLVDLASRISTALAAEIRFHVAAGRDVRVTGTDAGGAALTVVIGSTSTLGPITLAESHGRGAMNIDIDNGAGVIHVYGVRLNTDVTLLTDGTADGKLLANNYAAASAGVIARANWNYYMIENDSSGGIHNPGWVMAIFANTVRELRAIER
ncbi:MAG: carboxypeptidase regulatory-like domain-containing protein [Planctomycetota bacterium]